MPVEQIERVSVKQVDFCHQHIVPVVVVMGYDRMGQYGHIGKQYEEYVYCLFHNAVGKNSFYFRKIKTFLCTVIGFVSCGEFPDFWNRFLGGKQDSTAIRIKKRPMFLSAGLV